MKNILSLFLLLFALLSLLTLVSCNKENDPPENLTFVPALDATCTRAGHPAYYTDSKGNCYSDAEGKNLLPKSQDWWIAPAHSFSEWECTATTHTRTCSVCSEVESERHETATENDGTTAVTTCTVCRYVTATLHYAPEKEAGCEDGYAAHWEDDADNWYSDPAGKVKIIYKSKLIVAGTGHKPNIEWESDETSHWHTCVACKAKLDSTTHKREETGATEPGLVTAGHSAGIWCPDCGHTFTEMTFTKPTTPFYGKKYGDLNYCVYKPEGVETSGKKVPLVLWLHGSGERGDDNGKQLGNNSILTVCDYGLDNEFMKSVILCPQCPTTDKWVNVDKWNCNNYKLSEVEEGPTMKKVVDLVNAYRALDYIDLNRVYVMGLSMGGFGTWDLLARHSDIFAAGIPICGNGATDAIAALKNMPIYTFHCVNDTVVLASGTEEMVSLITAAGGTRILYKEFPEGGHHAWERAFGFRGEPGYPTMEEWLFAQSKLKQ